MDKIEARQTLEDELRGLRSMSHADLQKLIKNPTIIERKGASGAAYQIEIQAFWDDPRKPGGNLRVLASIDDGGLISSLLPMTSDFIVDPEGNFVGE